MLSGVLIVPYGIETAVLPVESEFVRVLIVPYGIETTKPASGTSHLSVLIVPYGIETAEELEELITQTMC